MWVAKLRIRGEKALIGSKAKKFQVKVSGYPVSFLEEKGGICVSLVGFLFGKKENKKRFLEELRKEKRVLHLEANNDFILAQIKEPLFAKPVYSHKILHIEPVMIGEDGTEFWTIGSWNRQSLTDFFIQVKKIHGAQLLKLRKEKITHFSIINILPQLTAKQKKAIGLAIEHGYYTVPRSISLKELAMIMKVAYSTYQVHLRKAEQKLLPSIYQKEIRHISL